MARKSRPKRSLDVRTLALQLVKFPLQLRRYFAGATDLSQIPGRLEASLATRSERFLELVRTHVVSQPDGPYGKLLRHAGCGFDDLCEAVRSDGLETALDHLAREGVYLTAAELKGKQEVVRGSLRFRLDPASLTIRRSGFVSQSSGTTGRPKRGMNSFEWLAEQSLAAGAFVLTHGFEKHSFAAFEPILPGVAGMMYMVMLGRSGIATDRWFACDMPFHSRLEKAYCSLISHEMAFAGRRFGPGFGWPQSVPRDDARTLIDWVVSSREQGRKTCIRTVASNSARVAREAIRRGVDLDGLTFLSSGEPMTPAKKKVIEEAGARTTVSYGFEPGGCWVGHGCANPSHIDEMHVGLNTLALIESPYTAALPDGDVHPLLYTTVDPSTSRLLINAETGDYATLERGDCGCRMFEMGLTLRVHGVRSYEKLTGEGLAYPVAELTEILEVRLPAEFGGGPCDYQLAEEEADGSQTHLTLRVHPGVGALDEDRLLHRLMDHVGSPDHRAKFMSEVWRKEGTFRVLRAEPKTSPRGKTPAVVLAVGKEE